MGRARDHKHRAQEARASAPRGVAADDPLPPEGGSPPHEQGFADGSARDGAGGRHFENDHLALRERRHQLSSIRANLVGKLTIGAHSFILDADEHTSQLLRVRMHDLLRSRLSDFIMSHWMETYQRHRHRVLESGEPHKFEVQVLRRGAHSFWAQLELTMVRDPVSGARQCAVLLSDVGERRLAREGIARLAALVESSNDAIFSRDVQGRIMSWNPSAQVLLGYSSEEIAGRSFELLLPKHKIEEEHALQARIRRGETVAHHESVRLHKNGSEVPVAITVSPIYGAHSDIVGLSEIARDIRAEKRAQQELYEQMSQLNLLSTTGQKLILGDETDASMWQDLFLRLLAGLNLRTCAAYVVADEAATLRLFAAATVHTVPKLPAHVDFCQGLSGHVARTKTPITVEELGNHQGPEVDALSRQGVSCYAGFPLLAHGALLGVVAFGAARPFTGRDRQVMQTLCDQIAATLERGRLIEELRTGEAALREADRRKDDFIATLAHELRNPLAPIRNAAVALRYGAALDPKFAWCRDVIERQVGLMAELLEDLLDVSRVTRRRIELRLERIDLTRVVSQAVETVRPLLDEMKHQLTVRMPRETITLNGDLTRLTQVLGNLLNNAAKYTDRGGNIELNVELQEREAVIRVKDSGIGIAAEHLPRVFELFSQVESALDTLARRSRNRPVAGSCLVSLHGGRMTAASDGPGKGSEFFVYLPIVEVNQPEVEICSRLQTQGPEEQVSRRVLVVDDNPDVARSLQSVLAERRPRRADGHRRRARVAGRGAVPTACRAARHRHAEHERLRAVQAHPLAAVGQEDADRRLYRVGKAERSRARERSRIRQSPGQARGSRRSAAAHRREGRERSRALAFTHATRSRPARSRSNIRTIDVKPVASFAVVATPARPPKSEGVSGDVVSASVRLRFSIRSLAPLTSGNAISQRRNVCCASSRRSAKPMSAASETPKSTALGTSSA